MDKKDRYSDKYYAKQIKKSNKQVFDRFYLHFYKKVFQFFWARTNSEELSKDLVQDVFLKIWNNRQSINSSKSIRAYLFTIAKHVIINHYDKKSVREQSNRELFWVETSTEISDVFDLESHLFQLIKKLPPDVQQVFLLSRFEGLTYQEISNRVNYSIKQVEHRLSKAIHYLKEELQTSL